MSLKGLFTSRMLEILIAIKCDLNSFCSCGSFQTFKKCQNETEIVTGSDVLHSMGIDIPVYCSIGMMAVLVVVLRIMGYFALKYKL